jgi:hypothetical protein
MLIFRYVHIPSINLTDLSMQYNCTSYEQCTSEIPSLTMLFLSISLWNTRAPVQLVCMCIESYYMYICSTLCAGTSNLIILRKSGIMGDTSSKEQCFGDETNKIYILKGTPQVWGNIHIQSWNIAGVITPKNALTKEVALFPLSIIACTGITNKCRDILILNTIFLFSGPYWTITSLFLPWCLLQVVHKSQFEKIII